MATSVLVTTIDHATDKTQVKAITNINPEADPVKLAQWIQDGVALSKDSFVSATLITEEVLTGIDTRANYPISHLGVMLSVDGSWTKVDIPNDGVINITTADIYAHFIQIVAKTNLYKNPPQLLNFSSTSNAVWSQSSYSYADYSVVNAAWVVGFSTFASLNRRTPITAGTISFTLHFDGTDQYKPYDKEITFNITEG